MTDTESSVASRRRRALTIGVSGFQPVTAGSSLEPLSFTAELVPDLAATLRDLGYETVAVAEDTLTTEALGARVSAELESAGPDDLLLVHVISHGHAAAGDGTVYCSVPTDRLISRPMWRTGSPTCRTCPADR